MYRQLIKDVIAINDIDHINLPKNIIKYNIGVTDPNAKYLCKRLMSIEPSSFGKKSDKIQYSSYNTNIQTYTLIVVVLSTEFSIVNPKLCIIVNIMKNKSINCNRLSVITFNMVSGNRVNAKWFAMLNTHKVYLKKK
jgi:hypothetical protein